MAKGKLKKKEVSAPAPKPAAPAFPSWWTNARLQVLVLFGFSVLLYVNTFTHDYTLDDAIVIYDNMFTTRGVQGIPGILENDTFYGFFKEEGKANLVAGGRYRPFTLLMFAFEVQFFGLNASAGHVLNALWYGLTVVVFYFLLLRLFSAPSRQGYAFFIAFSAALLFAAHPLHTEVVANIKGRDEIMSLLGSLGALYFSLKAYTQKKIVGHIAAAALFFMALLSKENAITFLAVVPLTYYFFTKADLKAIALQTAPFFVVAIVFLALRASVLGFSMGETPMELMNNPFIKIENNRYVPFDTAERSATILYTLGQYLRLLVFPHPLTHDYYPRHIGIMQWSDWRVLVSLLAYMGMIGVVVSRWRRKDPVAYGILFFLTTLSIVSNIVFPVGTNMSERLIFMPSAAFCLVLAVLFHRLLVRKESSKPATAFYPALGVVLVVAALFSLKTVLRNSAWKDNLTLFTTDIKTSLNSAKLRNAVGGELITRSVEESDEEKRRQMLMQAAGHLREAIRIHPNYKNAYLLMGNCFYFLKQYEQAIPYYQQALQLDPSYQDAFNNLGITYRDAGRYYGEQLGDLTKAVEYLEKAYEMRPDEYETVRLLGVAHGFLGDSARALELFQKAVFLAPEDADAWVNLGTAFIEAGEEERGKEAIKKAVQLDPEVKKRRGLE